MDREIVTGLPNNIHAAGAPTSLGSSCSSPIEQIPLELIGDIFVYCLPDGIPSPSQKCAPLLLCQVSQSWRAIALSIPILWSAFYVKVTEAGSSQRRWVSKWLERSKNCPLSIEIQFDGENQFEGIFLPASSFDALLGICVAHVERWQSFSCFCPYGYRDQSADGHLPDLTNIRAPLLENAKIHVPMKHDTRWRWFVSIFRNAPRLRDVDLFYAHPDLPWCQFRSIDLSLGLLTAEDCYTLMSQTPGLEEFSAVINDFSVFWPASVLRLDHLHNLKVTMKHHGLDMLFDSLMLPALRQLHICNRRMPWPHANVVSLLTRSSCSLASLELKYVFISYPELIECLKHESVGDHLATLSVSRCPDAINDNVLRYLTFTRPPYPNPRLRIIQFEDSMYNFAPDGVLADMVESRLHPPKDDSGSWVGSLKEIHINVPVQLDDRFRLKTLQSNNPDVLFTLRCAPSLYFCMVEFDR